MLKVDLHIHSINSGHAFGTFYEIAAEAARKGMSMIGISDHGPRMPGTLGPLNFYMRDRAPRIIDGVRVLWGCEANIISSEGEPDLPPKIYQELDYIIAAMHDCCGYQDAGAKGNLKVMQQAMEIPEVKILAHPLSFPYPIDLDELVESALERNVLPEINISVLARGRGEMISRHRRMVEIVGAHGALLIANSDAHFIHEIGDDAVLRQHWDAIGLSDSMLINNYPERLVSHLALRP